MGISKEQAVKELQNRDMVYVAYSQVTKLPYVTCAEETFNDQAWVFSTEEGIKEYGKKLLDDKILLMGMRYEKKDYPRFYGTLYAIGVNTVVWVDGEEMVEVDLSDIAKQTDMSKLPPEKRPLLNPSLQLSGIYFMQEFRRAVKMEEKENMAELEEEVAANLVRSRYLLAVQKREPGQEEKNVQVPYIKNKEGEIFQPVFTDAEEFRKFNKEKKLQALLVSFENLEKVVIPVAKGVVVNPQGFNLIVPKDKMGALRQRFQTGTEEGQK